MINKREMDLIKLYLKNLLATFTIREIMRLLKTKSYNWTYNAIQNLSNQGLILIEKKGANSMCSLNLNNPKTSFYISILTEEEGLNANIPHVNKIINAVKLKYYTLLITGSYASGKSTKDSDLDVVIIVPTGISIKNILITLKNEGELMIPEMHPYVFTEEEFLQMLLDEKENYGKEIFRNNKIIKGAAGYYEIIKEAIKHGFKG